MDNLDLYADEELYEDEEEEAVEEEGSNRTFIILAASLGGLLLLTVCIFVIWAVVINPRMASERDAENQAILATNEAMLQAAGMLTDTVQTGDATEEPVDVEPTTPPDPADTQVPPTATSIPPTAVPSPEPPTATPAEAGDTTPEETVEATPAEVAAADTATPRPETTPRPTVTPRTGKSGVPETGIGTLAASGLAVGLLLLLFVVRRMRHAV